MQRRAFLQHGFWLAAAGGFAPGLGFAATQQCLPVSGQRELPLPTGPLAAMGDLETIDDLGLRVPKGFRARLLAVAGDKVSTPAGSESRSDYRWHTFPDGGAVFPRSGGGWVYTSNSEIPLLPLGGCGALSFDARGDVDNAYSILQRTTQNCAGGATPWNTWISCEESKDGVCYECDPYQPGQGIAKPALGRFAHEAVALDAERRTVYLTEDIRDGRFYRWVAAASDVEPNGRLRFEQGQLEVMNITGYADDCYPPSDVLVRKRLPVSWRAVSGPDEVQHKHRARLRHSQQAVPGTIFAGGEGIWTYTLPQSVAAGFPLAAGEQTPDTLIYWTTKLDNRVWVLDVVNQCVELVFDNARMDTPMQSVDNLTVSPWGDILVAEDPVNSDVSRLIVLLPNRGAKTLLEVHHPGSEICGPAFTPDGSRLYFSSQRYREGGATFEVILPFRAMPTTASPQA